MYSDVFASDFIPTVNSDPHCDTGCLGATAPICSSVSRRLRRTAGEAPGTTGSRQEQVEHDRVGCRATAYPPPHTQRQVGVERSEHGSLERTSVVGLEAPQSWFCFTPSDPAELQLRGWGGRALSVSALCSTRSPRAPPCN